jgi:AraC-like DNA-binding protein
MLKNDRDFPVNAKVNKIIVIIGFVQSLFGILLLIAKRPQHISFNFLIIWLALIAIFLGALLLPFEVVEYFKPGIFPILFLFGPLLYMYLGTLTIENFRIKTVHLLHLLPFLIICIHRSIGNVVPLTSSSDLSENPSYIYNKIYYSFLIFSLLMYWFLSLRLIYKHKKNIPYNFSNYTPRNTLNWIVLVLVLFLILFIADFSIFYFSTVLNIKIPTLHILPLNITLFTFIIIFFGINQTVIYQDRHNLPEVDLPEKETTDTHRNDRGLNEEKMKDELTETILHYLKNKKPYLNPDYSLQMMVEDLNISRQKLSYLINSGQQKNFYKLINEFRIREVKEKLLDPRFSHYSVLGIGLDCGFNSKTSFNRIFKEETGYTPSEFKKLFAG